MNRTTTLILLLIITLILHLIEEIKTGFRCKFPIGEMPLPVFVGINILIYAFCFTTLILSTQGNPLALPLAWIFAIAMCLNGLGHIGIMILRRAYFPGGLSAFILFFVSGLLMMNLIAS